VNLLAALTPAERDLVAAHMIVALQDTVAEVDSLTRCPPATRTLLYGPRALENAQGVRDDLTDLLQTSL
jgi:hypothetical protein